MAPQTTPSERGVTQELLVVSDLSALRIVFTLTIPTFLSHPRWGVLSEPTPESLSRLSDPTSEHYNALKYTYYVQYHLHRQLLSVGVVPAGQGGGGLVPAGQGGRGTGRNRGGGEGQDGRVR